MTRIRIDAKDDDVDGRTRGGAMQMLNQIFISRPTEFHLDSATSSVSVLASSSSDCHDAYSNSRRRPGHLPRTKV